MPHPLVLRFLRFRSAKHTQCKDETMQRQPRVTRAGESAGFRLVRGAYKRALKFGAYLLSWFLLSSWKVYVKICRKQTFCTSRNRSGPSKPLSSRACSPPP